MRIESLLEQRKAAIVRKWFDLVILTYPTDTSNFLKTQKDPFANPVGQTVLRGLEALFDILLKGLDADTISSFLDPIIRIRAVQDFTPSKAVAFIFSLKQVIRDHLTKELKDASTALELLGLESTIDDLALIAFDIYMECREKIYELKANEEKARTFAAFKRAGLISEMPATQPELE
jgi:hypothetical protein